MAFKLNHVHLKSPDPQKTAKFYVNTLGANILEETTTTLDTAIRRNASFVDTTN